MSPFWAAWKYYKLLDKCKVRFYSKNLKVQNNLADQTIIKFLTTFNALLFLINTFLKKASYCLDSVLTKQCMAEVCVCVMLPEPHLCIYRPGSPGPFTVVPGCNGKGGFGVKYCPVPRLPAPRPCLRAGQVFLDA